MHRCTAVVVGNMPYSPSGRNALCVVRDANRCSAVAVESHVPYSRSGRNALCIVRDAHRYSAAVVAESYVPYSRSGRNALYLVRDAHRYSAVVIESYAPYSRSGRNALLCSASKPLHGNLLRTCRNKLIQGTSGHSVRDISCACEQQQGTNPSLFAVCNVDYIVDISSSDRIAREHFRFREHRF